MEIGSFTTILRDFGFPIAVASILLFFWLNRASKSLDEIKDLLRIISVNVGKTFLSSEQTIDVFRWCLHEHIQKKLEFAGALLVKNDIKNRREQIKAQLQSEFYRITQEEATRLSSFNTPAWDLGKMLMSINFEHFMEEIYTVFFSEGEIRAKILDMKAIMNSYVNELIKEIKDRISANYI